MRGPNRAGAGLAATIAAVAVIAGGCGGKSTARNARGGAAGATQTRSEPASQGANPAARKNGPVVAIRTTGYGPILVDGHGRALYLFTHDPTRGTSRCYGAC